MMRTAKEITKEEARYLLLKHFANLVNYWENESSAKTSKEKLEGLLHSILVTLDGGSAGLPSYLLIPNPHPDDKQYSIENGYDYYPNQMDISGSFHDEIFKYLQNKISRPENLYENFKT
jgi:hypothetical protein